MNTTLAVARDRRGAYINPMARVLAKRFAMAVLGAALVCAPGQTRAQDDPGAVEFFRVGTGSISGVYFPIGGLIANAISNVPGSGECGSGGSCGVPGLVAVAQATRGSVANVLGIKAGRLDSALVQADIAYLAQTGSGRFSGRPVRKLRGLATLYREVVHVVVRRNSGITNIGHLAGKRVSIDVQGSGTQAAARLVLRGYGIDRDAILEVNAQLGPAVDRLLDNSIDAFFFVGGYPVRTVSRLADEVRLRLLPIQGSAAEKIRRFDPFFTPTEIPVGTYPGIKAVKTLGVGAVWVTSTDINDKTAYGLVRALWHPTTRRLLDQGHPTGRQIRFERALSGMAVPIHRGAERYYREMGLIFAPKPRRKPRRRAAGK